MQDAPLHTPLNTGATPHASVPSAPVGRFAPSPSGRMHLGNIYTAVMSWLSARSRGGRWIIRIEDLDPQRSKPEYTRLIEDDLRWLGLEWDEGGTDGRGSHGPYLQSLRHDIYADALRRLEEKGLTYRCICRRAAIPKAMRSNPDLRIIMSVDDFDKYDDELTERESKNASETEVNRKRYKGITIETVAAWPDGVIVATLCSPDADGNFFAAVNLQNDESVIQIDKVSNASELYFFKLLMKADTNIAFGEEFIVADFRTTPKFKASTGSSTGGTTQGGGASETGK